MAAKKKKSEKSAAAGTHIALLRGINVGGKHRMPMAELVELFSAAGCTEVTTYIQSGNVVFRAKAALAAKLPLLIGSAIEDHFGFKIPVVTRSAKELANIVAANPFLAAGVDPGVLHLGFLDKKPTKARAALLDPDRSPPDTFELVGREIYFCCPTGLARTKLSNAYLDSRLKTISTVRNWRTVMKLLELSRG